MFVHLAGRRYETSTAGDRDDVCSLDACTQCLSDTCALICALHLNLLLNVFLGDVPSGLCPLTECLL